MQSSSYTATLLTTDRLDLVPATPALVRGALDDVPDLGARLRASIPATWPPEFLDRPPLEFVLRKLELPADEAEWWRMYFVVLRVGPSGRTLIGSAGYKGPPAGDGTVELGYGIVEEHQRRGYASEATRGLLANAFEFAAVTRVIAETFPQLVASIGVMTKCGLHFIGEGSEPGVIRYEISRASWQQADS